MVPGGAPTPCARSLGKTSARAHGSARRKPPPSRGHRRRGAAPRRPRDHPERACSPRAARPGGPRQPPSPWSGARAATRLAPARAGRCAPGLPRAVRGPPTLQRFSTIRIRPRRATRTASLNAVSGSSRNSTVVTNRTRSIAASESGSRCASPRTAEIVGCRVRISVSIPGDRSMPSTRSAGASQAEKRPVPHPTSRRLPAPGNAAGSSLSNARSADSTRWPRGVSYHAS